MTATVVAVIGAIVAITLLGIGLAIALPALAGSESDAYPDYNSALQISYVVLGLAPVGVVIGLLFNRFMKR